MTAKDYVTPKNQIRPSATFPQYFNSIFEYMSYLGNFSR